MIQQDVPIDEEAYWVLTFLSNYGIWFILAVVLIVVVLYKKSKD